MIVHGSRDDIHAVTVHQAVVNDSPGGIIVGKAAPSAHHAFLAIDAVLARDPNPPLVEIVPSTAMSQSASL